MKEPNLATLNVVQEVLRGITVSLATAARVDLAELSGLLQSFAEDTPGLDPLTRVMVRDLAVGPALLTPARRQ